MNVCMQGTFTCSWDNMIARLEANMAQASEAHTGWTVAKEGEKLQKFEWDNNGRIYLISNMKLCLTVAQGKSRKGGGGWPIHLMRNLSLELCGDTLQVFQMWGARSEPQLPHQRQVLGWLFPALSGAYISHR